MFESCRAHHSNFVGMVTPRSFGDKPHLTSLGASMSEFRLRSVERGCELRRDRPCRAHHSFNEIRTSRN